MYVNLTKLILINFQKILSAMKHVVEKKTEIENEIKNTRSYT